MPVAKSELKQIPGFSQGVRENAAIRMIKMLRPICPNSGVEMEVAPDGRMLPKRVLDPNKQNCQKEGFGWWLKCEERGHDPYHSTRVWYSKTDLFETDAATGEQVKTGERTVRHEAKYPNIAQVAAHTRVNAGRGAQFAMERKGFKRLKTLGYQEVCQFRNCQKPIAVTSRVGQYCSREHAILVGADLQNIMLLQVTGRFEAGAEMEAQQKRQRGLLEAGQFIDVQPIK